MYRTMMKEKGKLPRGALVRRIFKHFQIQLPSSLFIRTLLAMQIEVKMISEMRLKDISDVWNNLKKDRPVLSKLVQSQRRKEKERVLLLKFLKRRNLTSW